MQRMDTKFERVSDPTPTMTSSSQPSMDNVEEDTGASTAVEDDDDAATRNWKESIYAVGRIDNVTWSDEIHRGGDEEAERPRSSKNCHLMISGLVCSAFKAERVGNMAVLKRTKSDPPRILWVAGPLWFVTVFVTLPIIVGISLAIFLLYLRCFDIWVPIVWACSLGLLLFFLFMTSLSDPGILLRHTEPKEEDWIWNDQARTWRHTTAKYDPVCATVIEGFDHVCPWVGTAVGARNMRWFKGFVFMVGFCLFTDIVLMLLGPHMGMNTC